MLCQVAAVMISQGVLGGKLVEMEQVPLSSLFSPVWCVGLFASIFIVHVDTIICLRAVAPVEKGLKKNLVPVVPFLSPGGITLDLVSCVNNPLRVSVIPKLLTCRSASHS